MNVTSAAKVLPTQSAARLLAIRVSESIAETAGVPPVLTVISDRRDSHSRLPGAGPGPQATECLSESGPGTARPGRARPGTFETPAAAIETTAKREPVRVHKTRIRVRPGRIRNLTRDPARGVLWPPAGPRTDAAAAGGLPTPPADAHPRPPAPPL